MVYWLYGYCDYRYWRNDTVCYLLISASPADVYSNGGGFTFHTACRNDEKLWNIGCASYCDGNWFNNDYVTYPTCGGGVNSSSSGGFTLNIGDSHGSIYWPIGCVYYCDASYPTTYNKLCIGNTGGSAGNSVNAGGGITFGADTSEDYARYNIGCAGYCDWGNHNSDKLCYLGTGAGVNAPANEGGSYAFSINNSYSNYNWMIGCITIVIKVGLKIL